MLRDSIQKRRGDLAEKALEREREQVSGVACTCTH